MTKRFRKFQRERQQPHKRGEVHVLDDLTGADYERDETGRPRVGVAGISDLQHSLFVKAWLAVIDWEIGRALLRARLGVPLTGDGGLDFNAIWELAGLTSVERIAMDLVIVDGYSYQQAAALQGVSKGAIQHRINRGRLKLKDCFGDRALDRRVAVGAP